MIKYFQKYLLMIAAVILVGCSSEPMIKLSEERQQEIDAKLAKQEENNQLNEENVQQESSSQQTESMTDVESSNHEILLVDDPSKNFEVAATGTSYHLWDFAPYLPNQIKQFNNGTQNSATYMNYSQNDIAQSQVQWRQLGQVVTQVFVMGEGQIQQITSTTNLNPYDNVLPSIDTIQTSDTKVLLQEPLTVGTQWTDSSNQTSEITALYDVMETEAGTLTNIIEVTRSSDNSIQKDFYAQNQGFVGRWTSESLEEPGEYWQLIADTREVMLTHPITLFVPDDSQAELVTKNEGTFAYQTNGSLAVAFEQMFREIGIIDDTIFVNDVYMDSQDVATIDFTPGVVTILNNYESSEEAVIRSIVYTLGDFFQTNKVRLTVNGNGLLPNSISYPDQGIYEISVTGSINEDVFLSEESTESSQ